MGDREPVLFDNIKNYNNVSETTFSGSAALLKEMRSLNLCWGKEDINPD